MVKFFPFGDSKQVAASLSFTNGKDGELGNKT
jgi:hypothetical protein